MGGWRECRCGTLSNGDQQVYSRPGNDECTENAGSLRRLYARSDCGNSYLPSVFGEKIIVFIENCLQSSEVQCLRVGHALTHPQNSNAGNYICLLLPWLQSSYIPKQTGSLGNKANIKTCYQFSQRWKFTACPGWVCTVI